MLFQLGIINYWNVIILCKCKFVLKTKQNEIFVDVIVEELN